MVGFGALRLLTLGCLASELSALAIDGAKPHELIRPYKRAPLQNIVTWDEHSIMVNGTRVMFFSGEFHPFRLPVGSLYLDVFQKIKALGFNGVSFYTDWALLEGQPGVFNASGVFDLQPFFDAASQAGIFLLARPGPYINAEVSGGGFPGWMQRNPGRTRTRDPAFVNATSNYSKNIGRIIAGAQITNGGPVILFQPENEYTSAVGDPLFPDGLYMSEVEQMFRDAGIVVPMISNDASPDGHNAPGTGLGQVDIYGYDGYPLGFDCANPTVWPAGNLNTNFGSLHKQQSPTTPNSIVEFQGGSFDPWGGPGFPVCAQLLNQEFERVFWKNDFSFGVTVFNTYMIYGGTNWGNLGHPGGYTSYDYAAAITEERLVTREKYSEAKLEANFLRASPAFLTANFTTNANAVGAFTNNPDLFTTQLRSGTTSFLFLRHTAYNSLASTNYTLKLPTSLGALSIPQLGGSLTLNGRDSKIHVTGYVVGNYTIQYSTAEVFTWHADAQKTVMVVYGGPGEQHEMSIAGMRPTSFLEGLPDLVAANRGGDTILNWKTSSTRHIVQVDQNFYIHLIDRNSAYNYWVLDLPRSASSNHTVANIQANNVIVRAGYLMRTASVTGTTMALTGDLNATVPLDVISGAPMGLTSLTFNGKSLLFTQDKSGMVSAQLTYTAPAVLLPIFSTFDWKYIDSLPEIQSNYDDSAWPNANLSFTYNTYRKLSTPMSLYSSDYGFHTGSLIYRGRFTATGSETTLTLSTQGGSAYGHSVWLNNQFVGSWAGNDRTTARSMIHNLGKVTAGQNIITVLIDHMGDDENWRAGDSGFKNPRGILNYTLSGHSQSDVSWKLTGNIGGEAYVDKSRGPLNEGAMYAERQGYHLPDAPTSSWASRTPSTGLTNAGVGFFTTSFDLNIPTGYDIPMSFTFQNTTTGAATVTNYRVQLYVNGYQFGEMVSNVGPQTSFPVPEGILNYHGKNYLAMTLWSLDAVGAKVSNFSLVATGYVQTALAAVKPAIQVPYVARPFAY